MLGVILELSHSMVSTLFYQNFSLQLVQINKYICFKVLTIKLAAHPAPCCLRKARDTSADLPNLYKYIRESSTEEKLSQLLMVANVRVCAELIMSIL